MCEDPLLRLVFPLSLLSSSFYSQNGWSQGCGLGLIFEFPDSRHWTHHIGNVICPAVLIATWRFCCCSWRLIGKSCSQNMLQWLHVHPCLTLCLQWCPQFPFPRRKHNGCSWREGHFAPCAKCSFTTLIVCHWHHICRVHTASIIETVFSPNS